MKICLLGGTGAIGVCLQKLLSQEGHQVYVTTRSLREDPDGMVVYLHGNAKDPDFIKRLSDDFDAVVDFMSYKTAEFADRVHILLDKTRHYVFLSSARVFADSKPIIEDSPRLLDVSTNVEYLKTDEYALTKARQENLLRDTDRHNYTIVRPYITYGRERLQLSVLEKEEWLYRAVHGRSIIFCKELAEKHTTLTSGHDVASCIGAILRAGCHGETYNLTNSYSITWTQVLDIYLDELERHLNRHPKVSWVPLDDFVRLYRPGDARYQITKDRLYDRFFDNSKLSNLIRTDNFINPEEGLRQSISYFLTTTKKNFRAINWKKQGELDKYVRERASFDEFHHLKSLIHYYYHLFK